MSLKIEHLGQTVNSSTQLLCCFDVSKASLSLYTEYRLESQADTEVCCVEEEIPNRTGLIEQLLDRLEDLAEETGLIRPEHVSRLKTVESNDTGKTDHKDPRVMHLVVRLGKTQTDRHLPERYRRLRRLTRYYDEDEETLTAARQRVQAVTADLFPDYDKSATFTFDSTGPLTDFGSGRALLRYAGLNLRERQSGTYRGQTRLSKKGRPLLRKILGQTIFPVLRKAMLYGTYHHRKLQEGMIAAKAMVAVMRKFLCMLLSLARSGEPFDPKRFNMCESQYARAA